MQKEKYKEIRSNPDFLYLYFVEKSGNKLPKEMFYPNLGMWLEVFVGINMQQGLIEITKYLDKINTH